MTSPRESTTYSKAFSITVVTVFKRSGLQALFFPDARLTLLAERGGLMDGEWQMERRVVLGVELEILEVELSYDRVRTASIVREMKTLVEKASWAAYTAVYGASPCEIFRV